MAEQGSGAAPRMGSFARRILSALVMMPVAVAAILYGGGAFATLVAVGCVVLAWEWSRLCDDGRFGAAGYALLAAVLASVLAASFAHAPAALGVAFVGAGVVALVARLVGNARPLWFAAGAIYLAVPSTALLWMRGEGAGYLVLWLFVVVWATDIGAYAAGRLIGGPHLAPRLSPNKTWAGLLGGMVAAGLAGTALARGLGVAETGFVGVLGAALAVVSQLGDLTESAIKRHFRVKDMSSLIPGHGGLFDRVDGLLAAAPVMALIELVAGGSAAAWR